MDHISKIYDGIQRRFSSVATDHPDRNGSFTSQPSNAQRASPGGVCQKIFFEIHTEFNVGGDSM
jgi:hypothetical protein